MTGPRGVRTIGLAGPVYNTAAATLQAGSGFLYMRQTPFAWVASRCPVFIQTGGMASSYEGDRWIHLK